MAIKTPWPKGLYVLLDPETNEPVGWNGRYALQSDGTTIVDGLSLEEARYIEAAVNAYNQAGPGE